MLAPLAQQVFGVEEDIHALGEEDGNQLRVAYHTGIDLARLLGRFEALVMQLLDALQQLGSAFDWRQALAAQLAQPFAQQLLGIAQQLGFSEINLQQVGLELFNQLFQWRGNFGNRQNAGHVCTALEGMQRALQLIGHRLRQLAVALGQEGGQVVQMELGLATEYLQQLRVEQLLVGKCHDVFRLDDLRQRLAGNISARVLDYLVRVRGGKFWGDFPLGQRVCGGGQLVDIVTLALLLGGILVDQRRHQCDHIGHHLLHGIARLDAAIQHTVEQILDRPGQLADDQGANHATTALEGVESTADFGQGILVVGMRAPLRQVFVDGFEDFGRFLDEHFLQLVVDRLFIGRRRQQAWRHIPCRRINRLHRCSHDIGHAQRFFQCCRGFDGNNGLRQLNLGQLQLGNLAFAPGQRRGIDGLLQAIQAEQLIIGLQLARNWRPGFIRLNDVADFQLEAVQRQLTQAEVVGSHCT